MNYQIKSRVFWGGMFFFITVITGCSEKAQAPAQSGQSTGQPSQVQAQQTQAPQSQAPSQGQNVPPPPQSVIAGYQVKETFNVGDNVYVRSMAIDNKSSTLWVGTSVGVLEVDLASRNMLDTYTRDQGVANE